MGHSHFAATGALTGSQNDLVAAAQGLVESSGLMKTHVKGWLEKSRGARVRNELDHESSYGWPQENPFLS